MCLMNRIGCEPGPVHQKDFEMRHHPGTDKNVRASWRLRLEDISPATGAAVSSIITTVDGNKGSTSKERLADIFILGLLSRVDSGASQSPREQLREG